VAGLRGLLKAIRLNRPGKYRDNEVKMRAAPEPARPENERIGEDLRRLQVIVLFIELLHRKTLRSD
jgi:hypothetical protein